MKSAILYGAHDLRIIDMPEPAPPAAGQVRVRFGAGGICGSDLSYYAKFKVGDFDVREPIVLGHEVSGEVVETGAGVTHLKAGDRVAINPNQPCRVCRTCRRRVLISQVRPSVSKRSGLPVWRAKPARHRCSSGSN